MKTEEAKKTFNVKATMTKNERKRLNAYTRELNNIGGLRFERSDIYGRILVACMESDTATNIIREAIKKMARGAV